MSLRKSALCILTALALGGLGLTYALAPSLASAAPERPDGGLPLGGPGLKETRTTERVAPGVVYTKIERGRQSGQDFYTVDVAFRADRASAEEIAARLEAGGYEPVIVVVSDRASDDPASGPLGYLVRVGSFARQAKVDALRADLTAKGYTGLRTVYTGEDGTETTGPWVVHVLRVNPDRYAGTLEPELATEIVPERELLTSISARTGALAAINGGYFVIGEADGTPGDLAGISVLEGDLVSEAVDGRRPGYSVGASFEESAAIMDALGSQEAVNLDGGGSTAMTLGEELVNRPSDPTGERPIGDAVVLLR